MSGEFSRVTRGTSLAAGDRVRLALVLLAACGAAHDPAMVSVDGAAPDAVAEQPPDPAPGDGVLDPATSSLHDHGCAGADWQAQGGWVELARRAPDVATAGEMERCVQRYAGWVTNEADRANVSRASVYAALAATGQCDADHPYDGAVMTAAQCSGVNPTDADCAAHLASSRGFGIATLATLLASGATEHARDVPLMGAFVSAGHVKCGGTDRWKLDAAAGFVDHYVAAYNSYHQLATPLPTCAKHIVMSVALYSGMDPVVDPNGCWTYERVEKSNSEWKLCQYDGTVYHPDGVKWAYDDTNTLNDATTEKNRVTACASGMPIGGYIYMANRGSGWRQVTSTGVRAHFAELYSSQTAVDDQFALWKSGGKPGSPMINVGEAATTAAQIKAATAQACAEVGDQGWFGLYVYPQTLDGDRLAALVSALNACTNQ